MTVFI